MSEETKKSHGKKEKKKLEAIKVDGPWANWSIARRAALALLLLTFHEEETSAVNDGVVLHDKQIFWIHRILAFLTFIMRLVL